MFPVNQPRTAGERAIKMLKYPLIVLGLILFQGLAANAGEPESYSVGERLTYSLRWEKIPAGEAELRVVGGHELDDGQSALHFRMTARTNSFVDLFYKVRDQVDAYTDPAVEQSLLYLKKQREGSYKRDITVTFDWDRLQARYHNKVNGYKDPIRVLPGTYDPLSIFYAFRERDLRVGESYLLPVTDGVKMIIGRADVTGRETVEVPAGVFDCFVVKPELKHLGGVFKKSPDAELIIWVTADQRKLPVMISSKVAVGRFYAVLTGTGLSEAAVTAVTGFPRP